MNNDSKFPLSLLLALQLIVSGSALGGNPPETRPLDPAIEAGPTTFNHGPILYDPSGNITAIGASYYVYDPTGRVTAASVESNGALQTHSYAYDVYGNRTGTTAGFSYSVDPDTNHVQSFGATYDGAGNLTSFQPEGSAGSPDYTYDALNMLVYEQVTLVRSRHHVYTAEDQRLWSLTGDECEPVDCSASRWSIRDLSGQVLREFTDDGPGSAPWRHLDYVYRGGDLLASVDSGGTQHYSLDHLGTPRLITAQNGDRIKEHTYFPFGAEITDNETTGDRLRFTGHEMRDENLTGDRRAELDYMHARYYANLLGTFLSVDPVMDLRAALKNPQMWNRYSYVLNNPLTGVDPDGRLVRIFGSKEQRDRAFALIMSTLRASDRKFVTMDSKGVIKVDAKAQGGTALTMLKDLARKDVPMVRVSLGETVTSKIAPGPSRTKQEYLQTGGGGVVVPPFLSLSGDVEVTVDPRGFIAGNASPLTVMAHELMGHAWDLLFAGQSSERSAINMESTIMLELGLKPYRRVPFPGAK